VGGRFKPLMILQKKEGKIQNGVQEHFFIPFEFSAYKDLGGCLSGFFVEQIFC